MTIREATGRGNNRLWSCDSKDHKPDGWAPGVFLLEIDTGVLWVTQEDRTWKACHPTVPQYQVLMDRATALELDVESKAIIIAAMQSELAATRAALKQAETDIAELKRRRPA